MKICKEEIFGPVMSIIKFKTEEEVWWCWGLFPFLMLYLLSGLFLMEVRFAKYQWYSIYAKLFCCFHDDCTNTHLPYQVIERANNTIYGLAAGVVTANIGRVRH